MKLWAALRDAWLGWVDIVRGREGWREHFGFSAGALAKALVIFFFCAFLAIALGAIQQGMPGLGGLVQSLIVQVVFVLGLVLATLITNYAVKSDARLLEVLVPGTYGLTLFLLTGSILAAFSNEIALIASLGLVLLLYRLGRVVGQWTIGVSLAFAVATVLLSMGILLVIQPLTLYMLNNPAGSPI